jgi:hypothetical protein
VLLHPLDWKTPAAVLVVVGLACAAILVGRIEMLALGVWIVASAAFLVYQRPLLDHHLVLLAATLAVPAGAGLGAAVVAAGKVRLAIAGVVAVMLALGFVQEQDRLADQTGDPPGVVWAAEQLHTRTQPDELVGTDLPIVPYLADRRVPGQLVDMSFVRLGTGSLTEAEILRELEGVRAVVVGREFRNHPALLREIAARYPQRLERDGITIYLAP